MNNMESLVLISNCNSLMALITTEDDLMPIHPRAIFSKMETTDRIKLALDLALLMLDEENQPPQFTLKQAHAHIAEARALLD